MTSVRISPRLRAAADGYLPPPSPASLARRSPVALAFSLLKLTVFHEGASVPFLLLGFAVIGLLCAPPVRAYSADRRCTSHP